MIGISTDFTPDFLRVSISGSLSLRGVSSLMDLHCGMSGGEGACLVDLSGVAGTDLRFADVNKLVRLSRKAGLPGSRTRVVILAPQPVLYGICRMYQSLRADLGARFAVAASEAEASRWLLDGGTSAAA